MTASTEDCQAAVLSYADRVDRGLIGRWRSSDTELHFHYIPIKPQELHLRNQAHHVDAPRSE